MENIQITVNNLSFNTTSVITVNKYDTVKYLDEIFEIENSRHFWIFNKKILLPAFSFDFYDITDNSQIYLTCQKKIESDVQKPSRIHYGWRKAHSNNSQENLIGLQNRKTDLLFNRIEGDIKANKKLCRAFNFLMENENTLKYVKGPPLTIIESTANCPSTGNLPVFWQNSNSQ